MPIKIELTLTLAPDNSGVELHAVIPAYTGEQMREFVRAGNLEAMAAVMALDAIGVCVRDLVDPTSPTQIQ